MNSKKLKQEKDKEFERIKNENQTILSEKELEFEKLKKEKEDELERFKKENGSTLSEKQLEFEKMKTEKEELERIINEKRIRLYNFEERER